MFRMLLAFRGSYLANWGHLSCNFTSKWMLHWEYCYLPDSAGLAGLLWSIFRNQKWARGMKSCHVTRRNKWTSKQTLWRLIQMSDRPVQSPGSIAAIASRLPVETNLKVTAISPKLNAREEGTSDTRKIVVWSMQLVYGPGWTQWSEIMKLICHNSDFPAHSVRTPFLLLYRIWSRFHSFFYTWC